jgi:hypothetical protein
MDCPFRSRMTLNGLQPLGSVPKIPYARVGSIRGGFRMKRRDFIAGLGWIVALPLAVQAQQGIEVRRVAMLISAVRNTIRF